MTKAEKMFADAGWERQKERLAYWKTKRAKHYCISFLQTMWLVHFYCINEGKDESKATPLDYINEIDMRTLLAINEQCAELGWLSRKEEKDESNSAETETNQEVLFRA